MSTQSGFVSDTQGPFASLGLRRLRGTIADRQERDLDQYEVSLNEQPDGTQPDLLDGAGPGTLTLMDGERVHTAFHLKEGLGSPAENGSDMLYLTNRRILRLHANGRSTRAEFASIADVETVDVSKEKQGPSGFVWGFLGIVAALLLWLVIDHPVGSLAAAAIVALLGAYLIADRITRHTTAQVTFATRSAQLRVELREAAPSPTCTPCRAALSAERRDRKRDAPPFGRLPAGLSLSAQPHARGHVHVPLVGRAAPEPEPAGGPDHRAVVRAQRRPWDHDLHRRPLCQLIPQQAVRRHASP